MSGEYYCKKCGKELEVYAEYLQSSLSSMGCVDFYKMRCPDGHKFILEVENQIGEGILREEG